MEALTSDEATLAAELLQRAYQDLREEIYKTDNSDFRAGLKERKQVLEGIIEKLTGRPVATG
jgi:hypothetical protein